MSSKRKLELAGSLPQTKRQRLSPTKNQPIQAHKSEESKSESIPALSQSEISDLVKIFNHLQQNNIQNRTLDLLIFQAFFTISHHLTTNDGHAISQALPKEMKDRLSEMVCNKTRLACNSAWPQILQLKAQIHGMRKLCRDLPMSETIAQITHGIDNHQSCQRPFIDPLHTQNPSTFANEKKYDLQTKGNEAQTIEQLVFQDSYHLMQKQFDRRRMLETFVKQYEHQSSIKNRNKNTHKMSVEYRMSKSELSSLELIELQMKVRNEIQLCSLHKNIYEMDDCTNEPLLNPNLFHRSAKIGLHFDPSITSANHPPSIAISMETFPFYHTKAD